MSTAAYTVRRIGSTWYVVGGGSSVGFGSEADARDYQATVSTS